MLCDGLEEWDGGREDQEGGDIYIYIYTHTCTWGFAGSSASKEISCSNEVDETGAYYTESSKPERKTPIQYTNAYIWNLERW